MAASGRPLALITGASSGLGAEFARQLAARGCDLIVTARREEALQELYASLVSAHGISVQVVTADLATSGGIATVEGVIAGARPLAWLINNAGFGTVGTFVGADWQRQQDMILVHVVAAMRLAHAALPGMMQAGRGRVLFVSSVAGLIPVAGSVTYCATKAYLVQMAESLALELAGTGVSAHALCPGYTVTGFHETEDYRRVGRRGVPASLWMTAADVVRTGLDAAGAGRTVCVPGWRYQALVMLSRLPLVGRWIRRERTKR